MSRTILFVGIVFLAILTCCQAKRKSCCSGHSTAGNHRTEQKEPASSHLEIPQLLAAINRHGIYINGGFQIFKDDTSMYCMYMTPGKDSFVFVNLESPINSRAISGKGRINHHGRYTLTVQGDTLHLINTISYIYSQLKIGFDSLSLIREYDISFAFEKNLFLNSNAVIDKKVVFAYPYLYLTYGNFKAKNNADKKLLMRIDVERSEFKKLLSYPIEYRDCDMYHHYSIIVKDGNNIFLIFEKIDELYKIDLASGELLRKGKSRFVNNFVCFDKSKASNLAYTSNIDLNDESNINLFVKGDSVYVVKRLRSTSKGDSAKCAVLVFSKNMEHSSTRFLEENLQPRITYEYNNGFLVFHDSLNRAFYYKF